MLINANTMAAPTTTTKIIATTWSRRNGDANYSGIQIGGTLVPGKQFSLV